MIFDPFNNLFDFFNEEVFPERIDTNNDGITDAHFTDPHWVSGYEREDGTEVTGYYRDGDGNTDVNLDKEHDGGYYAHDPYECDN